MWWIFAALFLIVVYLFWPRPTRKYVVRARLADKALRARDWKAFDMWIDRAARTAASLKDPNQRSEGEGACHLLAAEASYKRGDFDRATEELNGVFEKLASVQSAAKPYKLTRARHIWGDLYFDLDQLNEAEQQFRAAVQSMEFSQDPASAVFSLQRLCDVLIEKQDYPGARDAAVRCVEFERKILNKTAKPGETYQTMTAPDLSLANQEYARAEELFQKKVDFWSNQYPRPDNIDVNRYQFHLAEAQRAQGRLADACKTLEKACDTAEIDFGPTHPRVARAKRKLEEARRLLAVSES
jgi:tetratricopeptide (TPR) repeat protein